MSRLFPWSRMILDVQPRLLGRKSELTVCERFLLVLIGEDGDGGGPEDEPVQIVGANPDFSRYSETIGVGCEVIEKAFAGLEAKGILGRIGNGLYINKEFPADFRVNGAYKERSQQAVLIPVEPKPEKKKRPVTWLTPFGREWERVFGVEPNYAKLAKALKPLWDRFPVEQIERHWKNYLAREKVEYVSAERFVEKFGAYRDPAPVPSAYERFDPKKHR